MSSNQINLLQGTLDLLILQADRGDELHGLGVSPRIEQMTRGTFQVKPGSLFPALHRLEENGWLVLSQAELLSRSSLLFCFHHRFSERIDGGNSW